MRALSITPFAAVVLRGPVRRGVGVGHGHIVVGEDVLTLTAPGQLRMPNGIATDVVVTDGESVLIGDGALTTATTAVTAGPLWDPRPHPAVALSLRPRPRLDLGALPGRGPGLTPLGDDILVGYLAAAALSGASGSAIACAAGAARRTTALSRTLLLLAARGALPEAAHCLLVDGDLAPLLAFGATSGRGIAFGLGLHGVGDTGGVEVHRSVRLGDYELVIGADTLRLAEAAYA
jgi:hypothetical protein